MAEQDSYQGIKVKQTINNKYQTGGKKDTANTRLKASQMKIIQTLFVVCGLFFICYLPTIILAVSVPLLNSEQRKLWFTLASVFAFMNCTVNPIIYVGMHNTMRKRFIETIQFWR